MTPITLVAAVAENGVIGRANRMPWHIASDFKLFKALTLGYPLVIGRKNFEAIGRPLPGRLNIIVSRSIQNIAGCLTATSFDEALAAAHGECLRVGKDHMMVIGGAEIYRLAMPLANRLFISHVHANVAGDVHFPPISPTEWQAVHEEPHAKGEKDDHAFTFTEYARRHCII